MEDKAKLTLDVLASWLGRIPSEKERAEWKRRIGEEKLSQIHDGIYFPPSQDLKRDELSLQVCRVDRKLRECASLIAERPAPFWPEGRPYALCLTHDIDRIFSTVHRLRGFRRGVMRSLSATARDCATALLPPLNSENPYFNFDRMRDLEREWHCLSACYVLFEKRRWLMAWKRKEPQHVIGVYDPKQIFPELRRYEWDGNEVGLHSSFDSWNSTVFLNREKDALRRGGFEQVRGVRNHYLNFDPVKSPRAQALAGFGYDSTMGFNFLSGFRSGTCFPYRLNEVWELPFQLMDSALRFQYRAYSDKLKRARAILAEVRSQGGVLVLNWHLQVMNAEAFPEEIAILDHLIREAKRDGAWLTRPCDVIDHWRSRAVQDLSASSSQKQEALAVFR